MDSKMVNPVTGQPVTQNGTQAPDQNKVKSVLDAPAEKRKRSKREELIGEFVKGDKKKIREYLEKGVIIPAIKDTIWNLVTKWLGMRLYENGKNINNPSQYYQQQTPQGNRINYWEYYNQTNQPQMNSPMAYPPSRCPTNYGEPLIPVEAKAVLVRQDLTNIASTNPKGSASIGDLYSLCGITPDYCDYTYGWFVSEIANCAIKQSTDGRYFLALPTPHQL